MESTIIRKKFFINPFPEYSSESTEELIKDDKLLVPKIINSIPEHWESTKEKINKYLKKHDNSVYIGTSGIALLLFKKDPDCSKNLEELRTLLQTSSIKSKRRVTFLCGDGGPLAIGAVVAHKLGDKSEKKNLIKSLISLKTDAVNYKSDLPNEFLYGRAGYLFSLLYVNEHISPPPIEDELIKQVIEAMLKAGQKLSKECNSKSPLMYAWSDKLYLGAAHGLSGIIYLLLQKPQYLSENELQNIIRPTVDYLATLKFPSNNYPSSLESQSGDKYVQWCHGAPGFVFMFSQAYKVFKNPTYLDLALKAADVVWERGLIQKGYSICHGVSGNAYCFLELYQTTKDLKQLHRAVKFAEWCVDYTKQHEQHKPDRPLSLYEGVSGPMYLLLDIQRPLEAKFPGYTL